MTASGLDSLTFVVDNLKSASVGETASSGIGWNAFQVRVVIFGALSDADSSLLN